MRYEHGGISFELATLVFEDERCLVSIDRLDERTGEQGWRNLAKKLSASSPRGKRKSVTSEDIGRRRWAKSELNAVRRIAARQAAGDDSGIDCGDIPRLTVDQLTRMVRLRQIRPKVPVSVRLDPRVLEWLKSKGARHLARINDILTNLVEAEQGTGSRP